MPRLQKGRCRKNSNAKRAGRSFPSEAHLAVAPRTLQRSNSNEQPSLFHKPDEVMYYVIVYNPPRCITPGASKIILDVRYKTRSHKYRQSTPSVIPDMAFRPTQTTYHKHMDYKQHTTNNIPQTTYLLLIILVISMISTYYLSYL